MRPTTKHRHSDRLQDAFSEVLRFLRRFSLPRKYLGYLQYVQSLHISTLIPVGEWSYLFRICHLPLNQTEYALYYDSLRRARKNRDFFRREIFRFTFTRFSYLQKFHVEPKYCVWRNFIRQTLSSVAQMRADHNVSVPAHSHSNNPITQTPYAIALTQFNVHRSFILESIHKHFTPIQGSAHMNNHPRTFLSDISRVNVNFSNFHSRSHT